MQVRVQRERRSVRVLWIVVAGLVVGGLLTEILAWLLPPSAAREFFVTTVAANVGPLSVDLLVVAFTLGPLILRVNLLSAVGIILVAWFARSLL